LHNSFGGAEKPQMIKFACGGTAQTIPKGDSWS